MRATIFSLFAFAICPTAILFAADAPTQPAAAPQQDVATEQAAGWASYEALHKDAVQRFVESQGNGASRIIRTDLNLALWVNKLVGQELRLEDQAYELYSIQLIGIAKHDPPVVHVHPFHPFFPGQRGNSEQKKLDNSKTPAQQVQNVTSKLAPAKKMEPRELTEAETKIIENFRAGAEVSVLEAGKQLHLYGPIRASENCLKCHEGSKEGDVLGALMYGLVPKENK